VAGLTFFVAAVPRPFAEVAAKERRIFVLNGSGRSPRLLRREWHSDGIRHRGILAATTPGSVDAWFESAAKLGSRSMADLFKSRLSIMLGMASQCFLTSRMSFDPPIGAGLKLGMPREILAVLGVIVCFAPRVKSVWQQWNLPCAG
jgi:Gamma-glutamyltranspeptidase